MSEEKKEKEGKQDKKEKRLFEALEDHYEKLFIIAKPAGVEPPTPQPEKKKPKKE